MNIIELLSNIDIQNRLQVVDRKNSIQNSNENFQKTLNRIKSKVQNLGREDKKSLDNEVKEPIIDEDDIEKKSANSYCDAYKYYLHYMDLNKENTYVLDDSEGVAGFNKGVENNLGQGFKHIDTLAKDLQNSTVEPLKEGNTLKLIEFMVANVLYSNNTDEELKIESNLTSLDIPTEQNAETAFASTQSKDNNNTQDDIGSIFVPVSENTDISDVFEYAENLKPLFAEHTKDDIQISITANSADTSKIIQKDEMNNHNTDIIDLLLDTTIIDPSKIKNIDIEDELTKDNQYESNLDLKPKENIVQGTLFPNKLDNITNVEDEAILEMSEHMDIVHQLSDKIYTNLKEDKSEMTVQLKPEILGKVVLKVSLIDDVLSAKIITQSQEIKDIIVTQLDELRDALNKQGYTLGNLDVDIHNNNSQSKHYYSHPTSQLRTKSNNIFVDDKDLNYVKNSYPNSSLKLGNIDYLA